MIVIARVTARLPGGMSRPGGPKDRAKGLMDALHDGRKQGPKYADLGVPAPLPDDDPRFVHGLGGESSLRPGPTAGDPHRRTLAAGGPRFMHRCRKDTGDRALPVLRLRRAA